jgi:hypothetical protein
MAAEKYKDIMACMVLVRLSDSPFLALLTYRYRALTGGEEEPYDSDDPQTYEQPRPPQREREKKKRRDRELKSNIIT